MPDEVLFEASPKQFEAWGYLTDDVTTEIGYGGAAHSGKTWLGCEWLSDMSLAYPGTGWLLGRKELLNLKRTTLLTLFKVFEHHGLIPNEYFSYNQSSNIITFANDSQIFLFDLGYQPSDPLFTRLGGLELTGAFVDESNEVPAAAIDVLQTRIGRRKNAEYGLLPKLFEGFNPDKGHVYARYYKLWRDDVLPKHRQFVKALPTDNPHTTEAYLNQLRNADKTTRERLLFGNFEYDAIVDLFTNTVEGSNDRYLVCDPARFGGDFIPIFLFEGFQLYKIKVFRRQGLDVTREIIRQTLGDERIPYSHALLDENGVGGGLLDDLKGVKGFVAQASPMEPKTKPEDAPKEQYENLKAQCTYLLAEAVNKHRLSVSLENVQLPPDMTIGQFRDMLIEDLEWMKRKDADKDGKLKIVPKDEVKEHIGRSPDFGDALMMRMWFELKPPTSGFIPAPVTGLVKPFPGMRGSSGQLAA
jgi:hypothetical protein